MRILTNRGVAVVTELDRHGAHLKDSTGHSYFSAFTELAAQEVGNDGIQTLHASLMPWFVQLPVDVQAVALFRQQCVREANSGFRDGLAELAQPGEPFWPFGESYGVSLTERYNAMSRLVTFERSVDRTIMQRVYDGEIKKPSITGRAMMNWDKRRHAEGLAGVVDGRSIRDKQGFDALDLNFRRIAEEQFRQFDGRRSAISRNEIERRIRLQIKSEGLKIENLPERLMEEYLSHHWRAIGRTTKQQKSRSLRRVSGNESFPAQHPSACCTDICRGDNLIYDPIQDRPVSVEIGSMMSTATRVVTAMRLFPRSANGVDVGLLLHDTMREQSMLVEKGPDGPTIDDWRWIGVPESLDFSGNPVRTGRARCHQDGPRDLGGAPDPGSHPVHGPLRPRLYLRWRILPLSARPVRHHSAAQPREEALGQPTHRATPRDIPTLLPTVAVLQRTRRLRMWLLGRRRRGRTDVHRGGVPPRDATLPDPRLPPATTRWACSSRRARQTPHPPGVLGLPVRGLRTGHHPRSPGSDLSVPAVIWLTPGHAGVEFKNLSYDDEVLEDFRDVRKGTFREQDSAIAFHHDPRDMTRIWFRHPDTDRIHEIGWRGRHLIDAPLVELSPFGRLKRGGGRQLGSHFVKRRSALTHGGTDRRVAVRSLQYPSDPGVVDRQEAGVAGAARSAIAGVAGQGSGKVAS
ncbi:MAG: hypothetical protein WAU08_16410 [Flavobacteriales bacterium]